MHDRSTFAKSKHPEFLLAPISVCPGGIRPYYVSMSVPISDFPAINHAHRAVSACPAIADDSPLARTQRPWEIILMINIDNIQLHPDSPVKHTTSHLRKAVIRPPLSPKCGHESYRVNSQVSLHSKHPATKEPAPRSTQPLTSYS